VCRLLHNKQHAPSESEWWCCIEQHYSDLFIMNGCRTRKEMSYMQTYFDWLIKCNKRKLG
jgi:hypothetical protein